MPFCFFDQSALTLTGRLKRRHPSHCFRIAKQGEKSNELARVKSAKAAEIESKDSEVRELRKELQAELETQRMTKKVLATTSKSLEDAEARGKKLAKDLVAKDKELSAKAADISRLRDDLAASKAASKSLALELQRATQTGEAATNAQKTLTFKYDEEMKSMQTKVEELSRNHDVQLKKLQDNLTQLHEKYQKMEEGKNAEIQRAVNAKTVGLPLVAASRCRMKRAKAHTFARNI